MTDIAAVVLTVPALPGAGPCRPAASLNWNTMPAPLSGSFLQVTGEG